MAESNIPVTSGSGNNVDVFTLTNTNLRQAVVLGDSSIPGNVAPVQATDPSSNALGVVVRDVNTSAIVAKLASGVTVTPSGTFAVFFDQSAPTVKAVPSTGTFSVQLDPGHTLGNITTVGVVSSVNSSTSTLGGNATFTGTSEEVKDYATIQVSVISDVASATDGLSLQQSSNGTNWDITDVYTVAAGSSKAISVQPAARFFRIVYTNGVSAQASFRLQTVYHTMPSKNSSQRAADAYTNENDLEQVWAFSSSFNGSTWDRNRMGTGVAAGAQRVVLASDAVGSMSIAGQTSTLNVQLDPGHTIGNIATLGSITNTVAVFFSPANPSVNATFSGSIGVFFSPSNPSVNATFTATSLEVVPTTGSRKITDDAYAAQRVLIVGSSTNSSLVISSITNTVAVFFSPSNPSVSATFSAASIEVIPTTGSRKITDDASASLRVLFAGSQANASLTVNGTVTSNAGTGTMTVKFDPGYTLGKVDAGAGTFTFKTDPGYTLGSIQNINTTVTVKFDPGATLGKVDQGVGSTSAWLANIGGTASIFTASGTASGVSVSGNTIISPSANASFKIFAYSIQTTGQVSLTTKFTNGAGSGPTEYFRPLITASGVTGAQGANLATQPGAPMFITGLATTLSLVLDSATLVHYSVSYTKESA